MRPADGRREIAGRDRIELEAGRRAAAVDDGVFETADAGDDRHRAIAERTELRQPAWLEARGHDQRVRSRLNEMGDLLVIADHNTDAAGIGLGRLPETILHVGVAAA